MKLIRRHFSVLPCATNEHTPFAHQRVRFYVQCRRCWICASDVPCLNHMMLHLARIQFGVFQYRTENRFLFDFAPAVVFRRRKQKSLSIFGPMNVVSCSKILHIPRQNEWNLSSGIGTIGVPKWRMCQRSTWIWITFDLCVKRRVRCFSAQILAQRKAFVAAINPNEIYSWAVKFMRNILSSQAKYKSNLPATGADQSA